MIEKFALIKSFETTLRDAGLIKKSGSWYRAGADADVVLNLQKSDFGNSYYLNVGVNLKALSPEPYPKINQCHIQLSGDSLVGDDLLILNRALNLEEGNEEDLKLFIEIMERKILSLVVEFLSLDQLRDHYKQSTFKKALLFWQAREMLSG